jgi:Na+-driven multidrug efflux pump
MFVYYVSLGMQDSWAPLKVLAVASFLNLFGDILLCTVLGYGIGGAAWATMASQVRTDVLILVTIHFQYMA